MASLDPAITAGNVTVTAANSGNTSFNVTSPEGCTASIVNGWNGGGDWVYISSANVAAGTNKTFTITQRNNVNTIMKPITIRLTNAIAGGPSKDITLTPNLSAPTLGATSGSDTDYYINTTNTTMTTTIAAPAGGMDTPTTSNSAVATASVSGSTLTVTTKGMGSCTITIPNKSDTSKKVTYSVSVSGKTYDNGPVYKDPSTNFYIAPKDAGSGTQSDGISACSGKSGASWTLPSKNDWNILKGSFSFLTGTAGLSVGSGYWSSTDVTFNGYYASFDSSSSSISISESRRSNSKQWRCISH